MKYLNLLFLALLFSFSAFAQAPITGPAAVCALSVVQFSDPTTGGTWSNSNTAAGTISPVNGIFQAQTTTSTVTTVITYTTGSGFATMTVTVNPVPATYSVTGGGSYCSGGSGVPVGLSGSDAGVHYQLFVASSAVGGAVTGTGSAISFGTMATAGTYSVLAIDTISGCASRMTGSTNVIIDPAPAQYTVSGGGVYCSTAPPGVVYCLCGTPFGGISYQVYGPTGPVGSPIIGYGSGINFDSISASGTYSVLATDMTTGCVNWMHDSVVVVINPALAPITGITSVCGGATTQLSDATPGGTWSSTNTVIASVTTNGLVTGGIFPAAIQTTVTYSVSTGYGCVATTTVTVNPSPPAPASTNISLCVGSFVTLSDATPGGTWSSGNFIVAPVTAGTDTLTGSSPGTALFYYNSANGCSSSGTVTVVAAPVSISAPLSICNNTVTTLSDATPGGTWSSSIPVIATIDPSTGIVFSASAGLTTITYTLPSGCSATAPLYVNPIPNSITGNFYLCSATSTVLSDISPGGVWSSTATAVATIDPSVGTVYPVSAGTTTISYTYAPTGCAATQTVTVVGPPGAISAPNSICVGSSVALSDATPGGGFTVSPTSVATVGFASGVLSGINAGTAIITYETATGCVATKTITVNPVPPSVTGSTVICNTLSAALSDAAPGGLWSSGNPSVATINTSTGVYSGVGTGTALISYSLGTGCATTTTVTINTMPSVINGPDTTCVGSSVTLSDTAIGGTWSTANTAIATVGLYSATVTGVSAGTAVITYSLSTGCTVLRSFDVQPLPTAAIYGGTNVCVSGTLALSDAPSGGIWSAANTNATVSGIGLVSGLATGTDAISYSYTNFCGTAVATQTVTISATTVAAVSGPASVCTGSGIALSDATPGGTWNATNSNATVSSAGLVMGITAGTDTINYSVTAACGTAIATHTITVNPAPALTATATPSCGGAYTLNATGGPSYTWNPTIGLSCSTCATTTVMPMASVVYSVTSSIGSCAATTSVLVSDNRIFGHIAYSGGSLTDMFRVWLIYYNSADSTVNALDSTTSCMDNGVPYYQFTDAAAGNYMVKAALLGETPGASGYVPTYGISSTAWNSAATVMHGTAADSMHINMIYGTVPPGPGFISGNVYSGAGKGTSGDVPVDGMIVYLLDFSNNALTYVYTDASGAYTFNNLAYGFYYIYPEDFSYYTTPSELISISPDNPGITGIDFKEHTTFGTITPITTTGIAQAQPDKNILLYPNPATNLLTLQWHGQAAGNADVTINDMMGREVMKTTIDMQTTSGLAPLNVAGLKNGIYTLTLKSENTDVTYKLVIQH